MNSFEVAKLCACTPQNIRKKTKQAANANKAYIKVKDMIFMFRMVKNSTGKAYEYIQLSDEIQPADVHVLKDSESVLVQSTLCEKAISAATESIGSLNFMQNELSEVSTQALQSWKKEGKNANSGNRENASCKAASGTKPSYEVRSRANASKRSGKDDAKRGSINSGGSSEAVKIPAFCKEYEQKGLCGQDSRSRSVWMESERSLDGHTIHNLYDDNSASDNICLNESTYKERIIDENQDGYTRNSCVGEREDEQTRIYAGQYADGVRSLCECYGNRAGCEREICSSRDKALYGLYIQAGKIEEQSGKSEAKAIECEAKRNIDETDKKNVVNICSHSDTINNNMCVADSKGELWAPKVRGVVWQTGRMGGEIDNDDSDGYASSNNDSGNHAVVYDAGGIGKDTASRLKFLESKKGIEALQKEEILKLYARAKAKGRKTAAFIEYVNSNKAYSIKVTENKLFAWQRAYQSEGFEGLIDKRTSHKECQIEANGLTDKAIELILASNKRIDAGSIWEKLNEHLAVRDALDVNLLAATYARGKTPISMSSVYRFISKWKNDNKLADIVRRHGVEKARGMLMPGIGDMSWNVDSINQIVEIDATKLDMICINSELARLLGVSKEEAKKIQQRFQIISIIDIYSHVRVYEVCESENSLAVARCVAKYILRYGKPRVIRGDNGKAFLSNAVQEAVKNLGIEYHAVIPYAGWKKPFVERSFGVFQSRFTAALAGYIGRCVSERIGLEGLYGKADKRAKKGEKTRLENLMQLDDLVRLLDEYNEGTINNTAFGKDKTLPRELYDEKVSEAVYMHEYEVMSLIGGIKTSKGGNKKGIKYLGNTFVFSNLFKYKEIYYSINLNNISQLFVFNKDREFLGIATSTDAAPVTAEQAKAEQKIFEKELRKEQKRVDEARISVSKEKQLVIGIANRHLPHAKRPEPKAANNEAGENIKIQAKKAANLTRNGVISDERIASLDKPKQEKKEGGYVERMMQKRA
ncbi:integrase catalytic domain-containing protein [Campylobacter sp. RM16187]|uniref:integrase catalytic domain-containing protein n=1 Tax=Campylobacter sp. RM16187 TaxID=1660063 RepID=UPI0021B51D30|nr:DDE-type integrase/transposase/recombinase [Campylobacter sp. RM16187]QKG29750.1 integrase, putative bacteriophage DNA transposition protein A [Campylobacter sp. RM16187]